MKLKILQKIYILVIKKKKKTIKEYAELLKKVEMNMRNYKKKIIS